MSTESSSSPKLRIALILIGLLAVLGTAAYAVVNERDGGGGAVVASVEDVELTLDELVDIVESRPGAEPLGATLGEETARSLINQWLIVEAVILELEELGDPFTDGDVEPFIESRRFQAAGAGEPEPDITSAWFQLDVRTEALVATMRAWATAEVESVDIDPEPPAGDYLCSSHVLVETEAEALDVIAEIEDGMAFADAAIEYSTGPSGPGGGDLGCVQPQQFVPEFSNAAIENGPGLTPPTQSDFGWHVILVRSIGAFGAENHPDDAEFFDGQLISLATEQRTALADAAFNDVITAGFRRLGEDGYADERFGDWDAANGALVPSSS